MKKNMNIRYILGLILALIATTVSATEPTGITALTVGTYSFRAQALTKKTFSDATNQFYHATSDRIIAKDPQNSSDLKNCPVIDDEPVATIEYSNSHGLGFKIANNCEAKVTLYFVYDNATRGMEIVKFDNDEFVKDAGTNCGGRSYGKGYHVVSGGTITTDNTVTHTVEGLTPGVYYVTGVGGTIQFGGVDITVTAETITAPDLAIISGNMSWKANQAPNSSLNGLHSNNRLYFTASTSITYGEENAGVASVKSSNDCGYYDLTSGGAVGFKKASNFSNFVIRIYTKDNNAPTLQVGNDVTRATDINAQCVTTSIDHGNSYMHSFTIPSDYRDATTFWIKSTKLCGIEFARILNNGNINDLPVSADGDSWAPTGTEYYGNNYDKIRFYGPTLYPTHFIGNELLLNSGNAVGIRLPAKSKITLTLNYFGDTGNTLKLIKGSPTGSDVKHTCTATGEVDSEAITIVTDEEAVYWIAGGDSDLSKAVYFSGYSLSIADYVTAPALLAIESDYAWYFKNGGTGEVGVDDNTGYMSPEVYHVGKNANGNGDDNRMYINGALSQGYNLAGGAKGAFGFKIKAGKRGVVNMHGHRYVTLTLKKGENYDDAEDVEGVIRTILDETTTRYYTYPFDLTEATEDETYWIVLDGALGGFEVLFDNSSVNDANDLTEWAADNTTHSWRAYSDKATPIENSNDHGGYIEGNNFRGPFDIYTSGTKSTNNCLLGPSLMFNETAIDGNKTVYLSDNNAIGLRLPKNKLAKLTLYLTGTNDSEVKIVRGISPEASDVVGTATLDGSTTTYTIDDFETGNGLETYWIVGPEPDPVTGSTKVVYFAGYDVLLKEVPLSGPLQAISSYYLWRASEDTMEPNSYQDGNYLRYNSKSTSDLTLQTGTTAEVLGIETPTYNVTTDDELIVKIAKNTKGKIRVYYTGATIANPDVADAQVPMDKFTADLGASYDPTTQYLTFDGDEQGWAWNFGTADFSDYTELELSLDNPDNIPVSMTVKYISGFTGANAREYLEENNGDTNTGNTQTITLNLKYKSTVSEIILQCVGEQHGTVKINSLTLKSKIAGNNDNTLMSIKSNGTETVFWENGTGLSTIVRPGNIVPTVINGTMMKEYVYDRTNNNNDWLARIVSGRNMNIAAIEVLIDKDLDNLTTHPNKNINWYVNPDTKMIAGSERETSTGYYAEFYVSKGRKPTVAFYMPSVTDLLHSQANPNNRYTVAVKNGGTTTNLTFPWIYTSATYDASKNKLSFDRNSTNDNIKNISTQIWNWQTQTWEVNPNSDNTQTVKITATDPVPNDTVNSRTYVVELKFFFLDPPTITSTPEDKSKTDKATVTITPSPAYQSLPVYYTQDSTDPSDLGSDFVTNDERFSAHTYTAPVTTDQNCIFYAAQFVPTPLPFYVDGPGSATSQRMKVISTHHLIKLQDKTNMIYVKNPKKETFAKNGGDVDLMWAEEDGQRTLRLMYGAGKNGSYDDAIKFFRIINNDNNFQIGAVKWDASDTKQDNGYSTYMDPYEFVMMGFDGDKVQTPGTQKSTNANPYTEMNGGIGSRNTEDGGMFLQPVSGDFFRLEPEFDGIATIWIRQNGSCVHDNMYNGQITRRPTYVVDENGKVLRGSTIKPTGLHHLSINGVFAEGSGRNQLRQDFVQTWRFGTKNQTGWEKVYNGIREYYDNWYPDNNRVLAIWFDDILGIEANPGAAINGKYNDCHTEIVSAKDLNPFSYVGTQPLYRDDWMYAREMDDDFKDVLAPNQFAKYGYEIPNFAYMRYFIPVKAGKSYYIGGRGTQNGFVAARFEPLPCNYNNADYRRADNPNVVESSTQRAHLDWNISVTNNPSEYKPAEALLTYGVKIDGTAPTSSEDKAKNTLNTYVINENNDTETTASLLTTLINGKNWWEELQVLNRGNMLVGTTINVDLVRNFEAGKWYPIVLPFSVNESRMKEVFGDNVQVLYLDPYDHAYTVDPTQTDDSWVSVYRPAIDPGSTELKFTYHKYQMLYANTPAFICPSKMTTNSKLISKVGDKMVIHFLRVTFEGGTVKTYDIGQYHQVTGSYAQTYKKVGSTGTNTEMYYLSNEDFGGDNVAVIYHSETGIDMKGTRCWIKPKSNAPAPPLMTVGYQDFSGEEYESVKSQAGIQDIVVDEFVIDQYNDDNVYDLLGRKVGEGSIDHMPKGVYLFHGKKVYVR